MTTERKKLSVVEGDAADAAANAERGDETWRAEGIPLQPIRQARLSELVAQQIRGLILEGTLRPGTRLPTERELAERFNTSRPTVREAINELEAEGLLQIQRTGMHVADPAASTVTEPLSRLLMSDPKGVEDYMEFRQIVEGSASYLAATRATEVDRRVLTQAYEEMMDLHEKVNPEREAEADAKFHLAIYEASHNLTILHVMRSLSTILRSYVMQTRIRLYNREHYRGTTIDEHKVLFDAIIGGKAEEAKQIAQKHIFHVREAIAEFRRADERLEVSLRRLGDPSRPMQELL
ncbi:FadR/GntR family transcriptional regulator [Ramlibacter sp.]|uniref:FadR/GntR family transcriptional regulator n=1 Tax=Ramlibacter sp. TaxID=1917967 RepID=UPI003D0F16B1